MKNILSVFLSTLLAFSLGTAIAQYQPNRGGYGYGRGQGMMGGYGYGMGPGMMGGWVNIPSKLPTPKNGEWVQRLREILTLEKESLAQYKSDQNKFNAYMPYMMVIPQEENHIGWIRQLFEAYGLPADGKSPQVMGNKTLNDAYELATKLERDLLPRYEWLVTKAEDRDTAGVLNTILLQSRWHLALFEHASRMGYGHQYRRGAGMMGGYSYGMGPGMMGGYGYGTGAGYGQQFQSPDRSIDAKEAEAMINDYLKSTRNPNLKLGKIKESGGVFEAEILTNNNDLVDKILIDKETGLMRSAY